MRKVYCDYCGSLTQFVDSKVVYGRSYGMIYLCPKCRAYVGVSCGSNRPLGRLANAELRYWKKAAHREFDQLWKWGPFYHYRGAAYGWLSREMGLPPAQTHIGMFDVAQCKKAIRIVHDFNRSTQRVMDVIRWLHGSDRPGGHEGRPANKSQAPISKKLTETTKEKV